MRRDQAETSVLFELIAERYERKSLAITANTAFSQWGEVFVDAAMTLAAVDKSAAHTTSLWTAPAGCVACPPLPGCWLWPDALRLPENLCHGDQKQPTQNQPMTSKFPRLHRRPR